MRIRFSRLTAKLSLRQTAALSVGGGLLSVGGFFVLIPDSHHSPLFWAAAATAFLFLVLGYLIAFLTQSEIESGIANHRWPEDDVLWLRAITHSPYLSLLLGGLLLAAIVSLAFHRRGAVWPYLIILQTLSRLALVTKEPRAESTMPMTPRIFAPIQSEHWGRPRP